MSNRDKTKLKPRLMQFSQKSYNSTFVDKKDLIQGINIDSDIFLGLVTERDFDSKMKQFNSNKSESRFSLSPENKPQSLMERYIQLVRSASNQITSLKDSNDLQQFCNHFQINQKKLVQLSSVEERETYVIKCMNENIDLHIQNFIQKQTERQTCLEDEKRIEQVKFAQTEKVKNLFDWLSIKTKYSNLKKKLTYAVVETINDNENQNNIKQYFNRKNSEKEIITLRKSIKSKSNSAYSGANTAVTFTTQPTKPPITSKQSLIQLEPKITQVDTSELKVYAPKKWNHNLENKYKDFKEQARINLQESAGNNKSALGIYPLIQSLCKDKLGQGLWGKKRDEIFNKFTNGELLDSAETQFISNTSSLLNSCMDKQFIQQTIKNLDQQLLEKLEVQIAENTLKFYETLIEEFDKTRTIWLENLNNKRLSQIKKKSEELEIKLSLPKRIEQQKRIRGKLVAVLKDIQRKKEHRIERQKMNLVKLVENNDIKQIQSNRYVFLFVEKMLKVIKRNLGQNINYQTTDLYQFQLQNIPQPKNPYIEEIKRGFHPSSKLFVQATKFDDRAKATKLDQKVMKQIRIKEIDRYKIKMLERKPSQELFQNFYTGGPKSERVYANKTLRGVIVNQENEHLQPKNTWITKEIEINAINKIKATLRSYIMRKKYLRFVEETKQKQEGQLQRRIKKIVESSKFMIGVKQQLKKLHDPTNQDLETNEPQEIYKRLHKSQTASVITERTRKKSPPKPKDPVQELNERLRILQKKHKNENTNKDFLQETRRKTRKILLAAKMKNLNIALQSGYKFTKEEVNCRDLLNNTPLFYSAQNGDENFCKYLIDLGADINAKCENGNTPTHMVFKSNNLVVIVMFLQLNADLNILNDEGNTPIAYASMNILKKLNMGNQVATVNNKSCVHFDNNLINKTPSRQYTADKTQDRTFSLKLS